jgi:assimilatory nitrate reductase catalytic subunit
MTRTARAVRLNSHIAEPFVQVHPIDAMSWQLEDGALAKLSSPFGKMIARVLIDEEQRPGSVFVPMHWNQQYAAKGRVDALVAPVTDPISGQPESKHAPVSVKPYQAQWHGFILSRIPLAELESDYWVKVKGEQLWRYELADEKAIECLSEWAHRLIGNTEALLEFADEKSGRYRAALVDKEQLQTVIFIGPDHDLPTRSWLSQLFSEISLSDEQRASLLAGRPGSGLPDCGATVCACFGVGENTIQDAIAAGANSVDALGQQLKAGTNCGSCIPELKKMLSQ